MSYDVYFKGYFLGDSLAQVNEYAELMALDTDLIRKKLPALLKKLSVFDHPLQKRSYRSEMLPIHLWLHEYKLILDVNQDDFVVTIELPPNFQPISALSIQPQEVTHEPTVEPAKTSGWIFSTHRLNLNNSAELFGTWRGSLNFERWHLFGNGSYGNDGKLLKNWRIEKVFWGERHERLQFGHIEPPLVINGQLLAGNTFGFALSNVFNRFAQTGLIEELPGGILELLESSTIEFFDNGVPIQNLVLPPGRYRLRDLFLADGIHFIDVRITSGSGRIIERRLRVETFASHPKKGASEYSLFAGIGDNSENTFAVGAAFYHGFSKGLAAGLHFTVEEKRGHRFGLYVDQFFGESLFNMQLWEQNWLDSPLNFFCEANLRADFLPWEPNIRLAYAHHRDTQNPKDRVWDATLNLSPSLFKTDLFELDLGWAQQVNDHQGLYGSLSRSWMLSDSLSVTATLNLNAISRQFAALISFSFNPDSFFKINYNKSLGTISNSAANMTIGNTNSGVTADLNLTESAGSDSLRAILSYEDSRFIARGQIDSTGLNQPRIQDHFLYFQTALLFANGNFAFSKEVGESFALINGRALKNRNKVKVNFAGHQLQPMFGTFGIGQLNPFQSNRIDIDPTSAYLGYGYSHEFITPEPGQGYVILLKSDLNIMAYGELYLPDGQPLENAFGELTSKQDGTKKDWFTGSDGVFMFEGSPGIWRGDVFLNDRQYGLQLELLESQTFEGTLNLGRIKLNEPTPLQIPAFPH